MNNAIKLDQLSAARSQAGRAWYLAIETHGADSAEAARASAAQDALTTELDALDLLVCPEGREAVAWQLSGGPMAARASAESGQAVCGSCGGRGHFLGSPDECAACEGRGWAWTGEHAANGYGDSASRWPMRFPTPQFVSLHREAALAGDAAALGRLRVLLARRPELLPFAGEAAALLADPLARLRERWAASRPEFEARMAAEKAAIDAENAADRALFVGQPNGDDVADA